MNLIISSSTKKIRFKYLGLSILNALAILFVCYLADNWSYSVLTGPSIGQRIELFKTYSGLSLEPDLDDYIFINIAYDKELVPVYDDYGFKKGEIDVTNRARLNEFLSQLKDSHKYIIFDVLLSKNYKSPFDSILIETILNTDRIVIAHSEKEVLPDTRLMDKSGFSDYSTHLLETNFVKYEFLKNDSNTIASKAYLDITHSPKVKKIGPFYIKNCHLQWKALTLRFPIKLWDNSYTEEDKNDNIFNEDRIFNLGTEILDLGIDIPTMIKDKIVVLGDFTEDDIHDTYMGKIAGPVINVNAMEALRNNELEIPWWLIIGLFILYTFITYVLLRRISFFYVLNKLKLNKPLLRYIISFIGLSVFFGFIGGIIYIISGKDINILIPAIWFTCLKWIINRSWQITKA